MEKKKFNISNYFNIKLVFEAFKQTRIVALIFFVCLSVFAMFAPFLQKNDMYAGEEILLQETLFNVFTYMLPLLAIVFIAVPIMYTVLFSFQTKRSSSDFYHSLPIKRSCQFLSFIAAIFCWVCIITLTYTLILMVSAHFTWSYFIVDYSVMINYAINIIICSALVIGGFSIGTTLTGTPIANVIASIGILIAPRIFIVVFTELIIGETLTLTSDSAWFIFKEESNILFATLFDIFSDEGSILAVLNSASIYTLILAIIYIVIGLVLFVTRPSETAAKSFRNKKIFTFVKYATGFSISLILVADIFNDYDQISEHIIEYALLVVGIGLSIFAVEAAYSKSIKSGLKSLIATPIVLLVDVALLFGMTAIINHYDAEKINGDEVNYMYVDFDYYYYFEREEEIYMDYGHMYEFDHFSTKLCDTKITDQKIIDYLLDIYNSDRVDKVAANPYHEFRRLEVTFDSAYGDKTRNVYLTDVEFNTIGQMLLEDKNIQKAMIFYPESNSLAMSCPMLTREETHTLYKTLIKELKSLEIDSMEYLKLCSGHSDITSAGTIYIEFIDNGHICYYEHTISPLTPETYELYMTYINESNKADILEILNRIDNIRDETSVYFSASI